MKTPRPITTLLAGLVLAALALAGCSDDSEDQAQEYDVACIDQSTQEYIPQEYCDGTRSTAGTDWSPIFYYWLLTGANGSSTVIHNNYYASGHPAPVVGQRATGGALTPRDDRPVRLRQPSGKTATFSSGTSIPKDPKKIPAWGTPPSSSPRSSSLRPETKPSTSKSTSTKKPKPSKTRSSWLGGDSGAGTSKSTRSSSRPMTRRS